MEYSVLLRPDYFEEHEKALRKQAQKSAKAKVPADVKLALYRQENYRRRLLREKGREINIRPKDKTKVSTATQAEVNPIIETLPKSLQTKGEAFLNFLQSIPELRINEKGEISYGGSRVIGSRIADLVHDFVRDRPKKVLL